MPLNDVQARAVVRNAIREQTGRVATEPEVDAVQVTGKLESGYGGWWCPTSQCPGPKCNCGETLEEQVKGRNSNNWGAVQIRQAPPCPPEGFEHRDSRPNADGSSTWYRWCYRVYPRPEDGAAHVVRLLEGKGVLKVARETRSSYRVAERMYDSKYYEGFGKTREARILGRMEHQDKLLASIARANGMQRPALLPGYPPPLAATVGRGALMVGGLALLGLGVGALVAWSREELAA